MRGRVGEINYDKAMEALKRGDIDAAIKSAERALEFGHPKADNLVFVTKHVKRLDGLMRVRGWLRWFLEILICKYSERNKMMQQRNMSWPHYTLWALLWRIETLKVALFLQNNLLIIYMACFRGDSIGTKGVGLWKTQTGR
jgi:hypothetical protein